jgi:diketogulonate reductase-like aldo/keto reductase
MNLNISSRIKLNNGVEIPVLGLGTYKLAPGKQTYDAVLWALENGYRLIDTASFYGNEVDVGRAVRDSGVPRDEVFITTKLYNYDQGFSEAIKAFGGSERRLDLGPIDLYLIHWPVLALRQRSWKALERLQREGRCRSIGVSNYMVNHLEELMTYAEIPPAVDQIEISPYLQQPDLVARCRSLKVQVESYSPLARGRRFDDPRLLDIAAKHGCSPALVMLRWGLQKGHVVIPKASNQEHILENATVFQLELTDGDMMMMEGFEEQLRVSWDPTRVP